MKTSKQTRLPNLLFLGADKCGSTWISQLLTRHPDVWVTPAKDIYYFVNEQYGDLEWYRRRFDGVNDERWITEVCHDYLTSVEAPGRILKDLGDDVNYIVTMREPVDRALSQYLFAQRNGVIPHTMSLDEALNEHPLLTGNSCYGSGLLRYMELYPQSQVHSIVFEDLKKKTDEVIQGIWDFLIVPPVDLSEAGLDQNAASRARSTLVASIAKQAAGLLRRIDGEEALGKLKSNKLVRSALYRPISEKPPVSQSARSHIKEALYHEVELAAKLTGIDLLDRWGWK